MAQKTRLTHPTVAIESIPSYLLLIWYELWK